MSEQDPLEGVEERLEALEGRSLAEHADGLEELHQRLVAELNRLDEGDAPAGGDQGRGASSDAPAGGDQED